MRLAFVLTQLEAGGAQNQVFLAAAELRRRGHHVDVIFLYEKRACYEEEPKIVLGGSERPSRAQLPRLLWKCVMRIRSGDYDAVLSRTVPASLLGLTAALCAGVKTRIAFMSYPPRELAGVVRVANRIAGSLGIYSYAVANSAWSFREYEGYPHLFRRRLRLVPNCVALAEPSEVREDVRRRYGVLPGETLLVTVGRLTPSKDHATLLRAIADLPVKLVIVGDGELRDSLVTEAEHLRVSSRVVFAGEISRPALSALLHSANLFVFPSRYETFGVAMVEAAAAGLPLIVSDIPVFREILEDDGTGDGVEFVQVGSAEGFSRAVQAHVRDPERRHSGAATSRRIAARYSVERHVDAIERLLRGSS